MTMERNGDDPITVIVDKLPSFARLFVV